MSLIPPQPRCKRCGTLLVNTICPMSTCEWTPTIVYGAPFPAKKCSGCEAGRKLLDAEREVRRRLREWLEGQRANQMMGRQWRSAAAVALVEMDGLERELLGEEK